MKKLFVYLLSALMLFSCTVGSNPVSVVPLHNHNLHDHDAASDDQTPDTNFCEEYPDECENYKPWRKVPDPSAPMAPRDLHVEFLLKSYWRGIPIEHIKISWIDVTDDFNMNLQFRLERKLNDMPFEFLVDVESTFFIDTSANFYYQYTYRVRSFNSGGVSYFINSNQVPLSPTAPVNLTADVSGSIVQIRFIDTSETIRRFIIERKIDFGNFEFLAEIDTTFYEDISVDYDIEYIYNVRAFNKGGISSAAISNTVFLPRPVEPLNEVFLNSPFSGDFTIPFDFFINLEVGSYTLKVTGLYGVVGNLAKMDAAYEWYGSIRKHGLWSFNGDDGKYGRGIRPSPDEYNDAHIYYYYFEITEQQIITIHNMDERFDDNIGSLIYEFTN